MILGPMAEAQLRNAMSIGEGRWTVFIERPLTAGILFACVLVLVLPRVMHWRMQRRLVAQKRHSAEAAAGG